MNICPKCHRKYEENKDSNFCLDDGTALVSLNADTLVIPAESSAQRAAKIRTMLNLEIENNINVIKDFLNKADERVGSFDKNGIGSALKADGFRRNSLPPLKHKMWDELIGQVPQALSSEEIQKVYEFYSDLENLEKLKTTDDPNRFQSRGREREIEQLVDSILENGNPLS